MRVSGAARVATQAYGQRVTCIDVFDSLATDGISVAGRDQKHVSDAMLSRASRAAALRNFARVEAAKSRAYHEAPTFSASVFEALAAFQRTVEPRMPLREATMMKVGLLMQRRAPAEDVVRELLAYVRAMPPVRPSAVADALLHLNQGLAPALRLSQPRTQVGRMFACLVRELRYVDVERRAYPMNEGRAAVEEAFDLVQTHLDGEFFGRSR